MFPRDKILENSSSDQSPPKKIKTKDYKDSYASVNLESEEEEEEEEDEEEKTEDEDQDLDVKSIYN